MASNVTTSDIEVELSKLDIKLPKRYSYSYEDISLQTKSLDFEVSHPIIRAQSKHAKRKPAKVKSILKRPSRGYQSVQYDETSAECAHDSCDSCNSDTELDAHRDPVTKKILLPSVSTWGKAPNQLFLNTSPWEIFGVQLDTSMNSTSAIMSKALI